MNLSDAPEVMTVPEVATVLRIARNNCYALVRSGRLRSVRIGRSIRVPRHCVTEFLGLSPITTEDAPDPPGTPSRFDVAANQDEF